MNPAPTTAARHCKQSSRLTAAELALEPPAGTATKVGKEARLQAPRLLCCYLQLERRSMCGGRKWSAATGLLAILLNGPNGTKPANGSSHCVTRRWRRPHRATSASSLGQPVQPLWGSVAKARGKRPTEALQEKPAATSWGREVSATHLPYQGRYNRLSFYHQAQYSRI